MSIAVRAVLASGVVALAASDGLAQTTGTGTTTGTGSGAGGTASGLQGGSATPQTGQALQLSTIVPIASADATGAAVQSSNAFGQFYANPLYQGRAGAAIGTAPGGFGTALYTTTGGGTGVGGTNRLASTNASSTANRGTTTTGGTTAFGTSTLGSTSTAGTSFGGTTAGRTGTGTTGFGATGRTGTTAFGTAGRTGITGLGGGRTGTTQGNSGEIIAYARGIQATAVVRLPAPAITPPQMTADLRATLDRSSMLSNPRGIQVLTDGRTVVLRGAVKDLDEAQTAEGMIRLTPGVYTVRNELTYPTQ